MKQEVGKIFSIRKVQITILNFFYYYYYYYYYYYSPISKYCNYILYSNCAHSFVIITISLWWGDFDNNHCNITSNGAADIVLICHDNRH